MQSALMHNQERREYLKSLLIKPYLTLKKQNNKLSIEIYTLKIQKSELHIENLEIKKQLGNVKTIEDSLKTQNTQLKH